MFALRTTQITVGSDEFRFTADMPATELTLWRRSRVRWTGRVDRIRQRQVDEAELTHYLHMLHATIRRFEDDLAVKLDAALTGIDVKLAAVGPAVHAEIRAEQDEAAEQDLSQLGARQRQEWAAKVRASREADAERAAELGRSQAAAADRDRLVALRAGMLAEAETARRICADAFEAYAGLYTKARSGMYGRRPSVAPRIPRYQPTTGALGGRVAQPVGALAAAGPSGDSVDPRSARLAS